MLERQPAQADEPYGRHRSGRFKRDRHSGPSVPSVTDP